jgi:hypothetical protein
LPDTAPRRKTTRPRQALSRLRLIGGGLALSVVALLALIFGRRGRRDEREVALTPPEEREIAAARERGHEANRVQTGAVVGSVALLAASLVVIAVGVWFFVRVAVTVPDAPVADAPLNNPRQQPGALPTATVPALPGRLPVQPGDAERQREDAEDWLHSYGWVDRQRGVVHIPIDRAIDLIIERGLPTREVP